MKEQLINLINSLTEAQILYTFTFLSKMFAKKG